MNYCLLISCSQRKILTAGLMPAIERYDGPTYRCLRKYRETFGGLPDNLSILIISGRYGLIPANLKIDAYNQPMTPRRAAHIRCSMMFELQKELESIDEVFINIGRTYMLTLEGFHWGGIRTLEATGGIGLKTQQMKTWLHRIAEEAETHAGKSS